MKNYARNIILSACAALFAVTLFRGSAHANEKLTYRLKWIYNVSVVGALYAKTYQMFDKAGLEVDVKTGGPERDAIRELELGYADFGVASADQVLRARAKGSPVVVIAQLFQVNPLQWIYRPEDVRLENLSDLEGKIIGVTYGGNDETIMRTLLAKAGISATDVNLFSVRYDYTPFYKHQVQLWPVYRNAQGPIIGTQLAKAGEKTAYFNPAEFGVNFVANSVVTEERTLKEKPELVKRFLTALLEGWRQALDPQNQAEAIRTLQQFDPDTPRPILEEQLRITRELIRPASCFAVGTIDQKAWEQTEQIMLTRKQLTRKVNLEEILKPVDIPSHKGDPCRQQD